MNKADLDQKRDETSRILEGLGLPEQTLSTGINNFRRTTFNPVIYLTNKKIKSHVQDSPFFKSRRFFKFIEAIFFFW